MDKGNWNNRYTQNVVFFARSNRAMPTNLMAVWISETGTNNRLKICHPMWVRIPPRLPFMKKLLYDRIDKTYTLDGGKSFITECPCGCRNGWRTKGIIPILIRCCDCKEPIYPNRSIYEESISNINIINNTTFI